MCTKHAEWLDKCYYMHVYMFITAAAVNDVTIYCKSFKEGCGNFCYRVFFNLKVIYTVKLGGKCSTILYDSVTCNMLKFTCNK